MAILDQYTAMALAYYGYDVSKKPADTLSLCASVPTT